MQKCRASPERVHAQWQLFRMHSVRDKVLITPNFFQLYTTCSITLNSISIVCPFSLYFVTKLQIVFAVSSFKLGMERQFSLRKALILL